MIELKGVSKSYAGSTVLARVDLLIVQGQTAVLIGPSGCGKSTLLRLMIGLVPPDTGSIAIGGTQLTPATAIDVRRRLGYVIQDGGLFPHLTARGNVVLLAQFLGWERGRIDNRLAELAELTHFPGEGLDRFPSQLSGGQPRVSLMRALMLDPEVILLDEPLGALDPMVAPSCKRTCAIFRSLAKTVVMVTHDLAEAGWFGHEILLMRDGRIVQRGALKELLDRPAEPFVTQFVSASGKSWHSSPRESRDAGGRFSGCDRARRRYQRGDGSGGIEGLHRVGDPGRDRPGSDSRFGREGRAPSRAGGNAGPFSRA